MPNCRYRIRKKFNLCRGENLANFLISLDKTQTFKHRGFHFEIYLFKLKKLIEILLSINQLSLLLKILKLISNYIKILKISDFKIKFKIANFI